MTATSDSEEWALRVDLAAAFRIAVAFDWHESVGNHFSAAVSADGKSFLLNPKWQHFASIKASDLLRLNADDATVMVGDDAPDATAWCIHGSVHSMLPKARVLLHCHPPYSAALCGLKDPSIKPIDQNTARFFNRITIDNHFRGMADGAEEGVRIARALGEHSSMIMSNHGVSVAAATVAEAVEELYFLERAAKTLMLAYSSGQELRVMDDELAEKTAAAWDDYRDMAYPHFDYLKAELDKTDPSFRD
jgi:ribulose-5-phosphate 4-epimerase/fuculose-1-phosphate aldolase